MRRNKWRIGSFGVPLSMAALALSAVSCTEPQLLRAVPHSGLSTLDPITTTAYITRNHGYLVYDTLFALDDNYEPQPQMVDKWSVSPDQRVWTFQLREGLRWHDGTAVTAEDCVASLRRWGKRDGTGQALLSVTNTISAPDARTIVMELKQPFPDLLLTLGKISSNVPFMMPKRIAETDANKPLQDPVGSGPFVFDQKAWQPGQRAAYARNAAYVPRAEPSSLAAGSRQGQVDRIEWVTYPNQEAAVDALIKGDVHYLESPSVKLLPRLRDNPNVVTAFTDPLGNVGMAVFNHQVPPFNDVAVRRAVLMAMDQKDYLTAAVGDETLWQACYSIYPCQSYYATDAGGAIMQTADIKAARAALRRTKYDGRPVVLLNPTDNAVLTAFTKVTEEKLRAIGMNVKVEDLTWSQVLERRTQRRPDGGEGWNMFHTWWAGADLFDPTKIAFSGNPETGWLGWPSDPVLERLRAAFVAASDEADRQALAQKVQERIWSRANFAILGQFFEPIAFRHDVTGIQSPLQMYYNLGLRKKR